MRIGFGLPVSGAWATPANITHFARRAEELGYGSLWTFQRLLVDADQPPPPNYRSVLDPLLALTFAAAHTTRIRLGVAVVNLPFISPAYLAKQATTLDVLSGGRLDLGLGTGHSPAEFTATGGSMERRGARADEYLRVLRTLWADEVSAFQGEFYTVPPTRMDPRPVQKPGPPVLVGGVAKAALRRAGRLGDGWVSRSATDLSSIGADIAIVRAAAAEAGRDPAALRVVSRGVLRLGERTDAPLSGTPAQVRADVEWLATQGVTEIFYDLNWDPAIAAPDADPTAAVARAEEILETLAPAR
ncbi:TIGR03619 family F420-dependent LLM class oxidoreductase [Virgisporangium ochraceum]|uniref:LLM class F420-dependent oxidoreductase n=1 Tax=Virgisporangium ochraceum TaxID=65505 RepID=A0A8J3ZNK6_9ACTN|nr:TIGR03619 family F420-dependent LLM class oxidoreductase [Virgisporangium ochraceum]GIJ67292.1 LLM class F420-dependent oxidoreductase [Virgisporangium ochraceum]